MNKIWLIIQREFLNRVQKKSFLVATILIPLIFPAIIGPFRRPRGPGFLVGC